MTQIDLRSLSQYVFEGPSIAEDEASHNARMLMEQLGVISPCGPLILSFRTATRGFFRLPTMLARLLLRGQAIGKEHCG